MIKIRNEFEFNNWFKKNYSKLGFARVAKDNGGRFPDFIMEKDGRRTRVELETLSSNFILHKHQKSKVDFVVCIKQDEKIDVPIIIAKNFKLVGLNGKRPYSLEELIINIIRKEKIVTSSEIAKTLKVSWGTAERSLKELLLNDRIIRIKKKGVTLWLIK